MKQFVMLFLFVESFSLDKVFRSTPRNTDIIWKDADEEVVGIIYLPGFPAQVE